MAKRRGRGEGSIYFDEARQLWVSQVSLGRDPISGKRRRETVYGATKKEVQDKLLELHQKAADGRLDRPDMSVKDFLEFWLGHVKHRVSPSSHERYSISVHKHVAPRLGKGKLGDLSAFSVAQLYRDLEAAGVEAPTRHFAGKVLRQALRYAVRFGCLTVNPADRVDIPHKPRAKIRPMNPDEVAALFRVAAADRLYALYVLAVDSGARAGELAALVWADLDEGRGEIIVNKTLERTGKGREPKEPKTQASNRRILLSAPTLASLREHRQRMAEEGHAGPTDPMFCTPKGTRLIHVHLSDRNLAPLLARAGLSGFRFHDLRHTCATLLLLAGVHVKVVSERLGHASIAITLDTYSHVLPTMQTQVAEKMGAILDTAMRAAAEAPPVENGSSLAANGAEVA